LGGTLELVVVVKRGRRKDRLGEEELGTEDEVEGEGVDSGRGSANRVRLGGSEGLEAIVIMQSGR
jgi:hypothetical protein